MKKLLIIGAMALATTAFASDFLTQSFISPTVRTIELGSNLTTGTFPGVTNLDSGHVFLGGISPAKCTNIVGMTWTNSSGTSNTVAAGDLSKTNVNLLSDINLWVDKNGTPFQPLKLQDTYKNITAAGTNAYVANETFYSSPAVVTVEGQVRGASSTTLLLVFQPIPFADADPSTTLQDWVVSVTCGSATNFCVTTNAPLYKWGGFSKLRLVSVSNPGHDENDMVYLTAVKFTGWVP